MSSHNDKRKHVRLEGRGTAFIELLSAAVDKPGQAPILVCKSVDISRTGLRVCLDEPIEERSILQLGMDLPELEHTLYLIGEVRWSRPTDDGDGYWVGFELIESDETNIDEWYALVDALLSTT